MQLPPLREYQSEADYRTHYECVYCRGVIFTFDGIRIYFDKQRFGHAFYESSGKGVGRKENFSSVRAKRIDWIKATLESPKAIMYQGWDKHTGKYAPERRVSLTYENFVVIIELRIGADGNFKGKFVTCYQADKSIEKIRRSPKWSREECLAALKKGR